MLLRPARSRVGCPVLIAAACTCAVAWASPPADEVRVQFAADNRYELRVTSDSGYVAARACGLVIATSANELFWADPDDKSLKESTFRTVRPLPPDARAARAWAVPRDIVRRLTPTWPVPADLRAEIDAIGPGGVSVWLHAGAEEGVRAGDSWWLRIGAQPAARLDVLYVGEQTCFCAVTHLAREVPLRAGLTAALWPAPGERRISSATSAVTYIDHRGPGGLIWIAAPRHVVAPAEPHVDFYHANRYIGHGLVERRDARFWYARFTPLAVKHSGAEPAPSTTSAPTTPTAESPQVTVGDDVVIRTAADIESRRFAARVFDLTAAGAIINAGETAGIEVGAAGVVIRDGVPIGSAVVTRVQRSYAVASAYEQSERELELRLRDQVRFGPARPGPRLIGVVDEVIDDLALRISVAGSDVPLMRPLLMRAGGKPVGVAVLVRTAGGFADGFIVPHSVAGPIQPGARVYLDPT